MTIFTSEPGPGRTRTGAGVKPSPPFLALLVGLSASCGTPSFTVPQGPHRAEVEASPEPVQVAPPNARIEVVPLRRNPRCFYRDGYYRPLGGSWQWQEGAWVLPKSGCYYAPPTTHYEKVEGGTTLVHRPGVWLTTGQKPEICPEPRPCPPLHVDDE